MKGNKAPLNLLDRFFNSYALKKHHYQYNFSATWLALLSFCLICFLFVCIWFQFLIYLDVSDGFILQFVCFMFLK